MRRSSTTALVGGQPDEDVQEQVDQDEEEHQVEHFPLSGRRNPGPAKMLVRPPMTTGHAGDRRPGPPLPARAAEPRRVASRASAWSGSEPKS
jgi:hypothetical protein